MDKENYKQLVSELINEKQILKQQLHDTKQENLRLQLELKCGAPTDGLEVGQPSDYGEANWIYESPDGGKTIYQRRMGELDISKRKLLYSEDDNPNQLNLFND